MASRPMGPVGLNTLLWPTWRLRARDTQFTGSPVRPVRIWHQPNPSFPPSCFSFPPTRWGLFLNSNFLTGWGRGEDRKPPHVRMGQEVWSEDLLKVQKTAKELEKTVTFNFFIILEIN